MPTYPYACTACGHAFEVQQSFSDPSLTECPECAGRLRKVFSSVGVVFKGSGFYRTDSRSGKTSATSGSAASGSTGSDGGSSTSSSGTTKSDPGARTPSAKPAAITSSAPAAAAGS